MQLTKLRLIQKKGIYLIERFAFGLFFFFSNDIKRKIQIQRKCYGGLIIWFLDEVFQLINIYVKLSKY